jgi:hypothetical protein
MDLNIYTKPNLLIENFKNLKSFDPNSFGLDCWSMEFPDFRKAVNLVIDTTVLSTELMEY